MISIGDCSYLFDKDLLSSFAFHHTDGQMVAIRFGLSHAAEMCRGGLTPIEIVLPVPEALRTDLEAAAGGVSGPSLGRAD
jgi:hypothetical protein